MYQEYFGLHRIPFKLTPDIACFFAEGNRQAILQALIYALKNGDGITKVIGEVGSGKTLMSRKLAQSLGNSFEVLYLLNPRIGADKILYAIAVELGLDASQHEDKVSLLHKLHNRLLELHTRNKQTVLMIDEAQAIPLETLEEIRMLSNLETGNHKLMQIVLFGQPELDTNLDRHEIRQIKERIIHSFYLPGLRSEEVARYLDFRLQKAGYANAFPFTFLAVKWIACFSSGYLRRINVLADKCMLKAFSLQKKKVSSFQVFSVVFENKFQYKIPFILAICLALLLLYRGGDHFIGQYGPYMLDLLKQQSVNTIYQTPKQQEISDTHAQLLEQTPLATASEPETMTLHDGYAIRLMQLKGSSEANIKKAIHRIIPDDLRQQVFIYQYRPKILHLYLGQFESYSEANSKLQHIPSKLQAHQPYVIEIKKLVDRYNEQPITLKGYLLSH